MVNRATLTRYLCNIGDTITVEEADVIMNSVSSDKEGRSINVAELITRLFFA